MKFHFKVAPIVAAFALTACGGGGGGGNEVGGVGVSGDSGGSVAPTFAVGAAITNLHTNSNTFTSERTDPLFGLATITEEFTPLADTTISSMPTKLTRITSVQRVNGSVASISITGIFYRLNPFYPVGSTYTSDGESGVFVDSNQVALPTTASVGAQGYLSTTSLGATNPIKLYNTWDLQRDTDSTAWLCIHSYLPVVADRESDCYKIDTNGTIRGAALFRKVRGAIVTYMPAGQASGTTPVSPVSQPVAEPVSQQTPSQPNVSQPAPAAPATPTTPIAPAAPPTSQPIPTAPAAPQPAPTPTPEAPTSSPPPSFPTVPSDPSTPTPVNNGPLTVTSVTAPNDGQSVSGVVTLEVSGTGMVNVELLPANGYTPIYGRFVVSPDGTLARLSFNSAALPNGLNNVRISAFNRLPGAVDASEIVAMPARRWIISN